MVSPLVSFHPDVFKVFLNHLHDTYGSAGDSILFQMSKDFSKQGMALIAQQMHMEEEHDTERVIDAFRDRMHLNGWGEFTVTHADYDEIEFEITLSDCPFKEIYLKDDSCMHYFYRGALAGFFEYLLETPMMIKKHKTVKGKTIVFYLSKQY
ncbi:MAG: hypothetical protein ACTSPB_24000 [Candidatus Thorarchaeota archaeon]